MFDKRLGKNVNPIGLGTAFTSSEIRNSTKTVKIIRESVSLGSNFIDTAGDYNDGKSEILLGRAIKGIRDQAFIASKFSPQQSKYNQVIKSCEDSLRRMKTDYIDLFQLHWPNPKVPLDETLSGLHNLKKGGKIKNIGISNFSFGMLLKHKNIIHKYKISTLQCEYNLFERTVEEDGTLEFCRNNGLVFIAYSPLDQGRVSNMNKKQTNLIVGLAKKYDKTVTQIILNWIIDNNNTIAISKTSSTVHLKENREAVNFKLEKSDAQKIETFFYNRIRHIPTNKIHVLKNGERNRRVYQTLDEALENKLKFVPSPRDLAGEIKQGSFLRPVRLIPSSQKGMYDLINGRIRYWAWIIAFGYNKPIPAYIRHNL